MCLALGETGRGFLSRLQDDHLSSAELRQARDHLLPHFDDPLDELPTEEPALAALVTGVVMASEAEPASESALRLAFQQLELRRLERAARRAGADGEFDRQRALYSSRERLREQMAELSEAGG